MKSDSNWIHESAGKRRNYLALKYDRCEDLFLRKSEKKKEVWSRNSLKSGDFLRETRKGGKGF